MQKQKLVFTDSGLGGLTIMADFIALAKKQSLAVDAVFFNAQYSRGLGYKKMKPNQQIAVFNRVLESIQKKHKPDIIAIACNTLSVVFQQTAFSKKNKTTQVLDIIKVGKSLIKNSKTPTILEVAMPTTITSKIYQNNLKNSIRVASDVLLPDAIENGYTAKIKQMLQRVFEKAKKQIKEQSLENSTTSLFLGCTHFPIIKENFLSTAKLYGINVQKILDPNTAFSQLVLTELLKNDKTSKAQTSTIQVVSKMPFQENEINNISKLIEKLSFETAESLRNYTLDQNLF